MIVNRKLYVRSLALMRAAPNFFSLIKIHSTIDKIVEVVMIIPSPTIKFPQGSVPSAIPRLPKSVGIKFITEAAVPTLSFASLSKISIVNGLTTAPIAVNGRNAGKKIIAAAFPTVKTKIPLNIATKNVNLNNPAFDNVSFNFK